MACAILVVLLLAALAATSGSLSASTVFDSPIQPSRTPKPSATPRPTRTPRAMPTLGAFVSPLLATPTLPPRVWLPLVVRDWPIKYGWKGVADTNEVLSATKANGFWGLNPGWYYNWGYAGPWAAAHGGQAQDAAVAAALMAAAMDDPAYVPMIWCSDDVNAGMAPPTAEAIARDHPGRVWLVFNEPDLRNNANSCGYFISQKYGAALFDGSPANSVQLGQYIAKQYIRYYDAIKAADPTARLFPFGGAFLPKEMGPDGAKEVYIWNGFTSYLSSPTAEPNRTPRPLSK